MIDGELYQKCFKASKNMWCSKKRGYINSKKDPRRAERTGLLGEAAFAKLFNLSLEKNFKYKKFGEKVDFILHGQKIDIKTGQDCNSRRAYIPAINKWRKSVELNSDIYVFCYINEEKLIRDEEKNVLGGEYAEVVIAGYLLKKHILKYTPKRTPKDTKRPWWNYEIWYDDSLDINKLLKRHVALTS